ncbi:MAG TPA: hypothetical protein VM529_03940 [Gemmata sp.]|nr:hypothetical protein [Gemmata sp.]
MSLAIGCNKPAPNINLKVGGPPRDLLQLEQLVEEFTKALDAQTARAERAEDVKLSVEERLKAIEEALAEDDHINKKLDAVTAELKAITQAGNFDARRYEQINPQLEKQINRSVELLERLSKANTDLKKLVEGKDKP